MPHDMIYQAYLFAYRSHKGQYRKYTGEDYINHPVAVALKAQYYHHAYGDDFIISAFLHDTIEDCGVKYSEIYFLFGKNVADTVLALTNVEDQNPALKELKRVERFKLNMEKLAKQPDHVVILKGLDRWCNLLDFPLDNKECVHFLRKKYIRESEEIYQLVYNKIYTLAFRHHVIFGLKEQLDYLKEQVNYEAIS